MDLQRAGHDWATFTLLLQRDNQIRPVLYCQNPWHFVSRGFREFELLFGSTAAEKSVSSQESVKKVDFPYFKEGMVINQCLLCYEQGKPSVRRECRLRTHWMGTSKMPSEGLAFIESSSRAFWTESCRSANVFQWKTGAKWQCVRCPPGRLHRCAMLNSVPQGFGLRTQYSTKDKWWQNAENDIEFY